MNARALLYNPKVQNMLLLLLFSGQMACKLARQKDCINNGCSYQVVSFCRESGSSAQSSADQSSTCMHKTYRVVHKQDNNCGAAAKSRAHLPAVSVTAFTEARAFCSLSCPALPLNQARGCSAPALKPSFWPGKAPSSKRRKPWQWSDKLDAAAGSVRACTAATHLPHVTSFPDNTIIQVACHSRHWVIFDPQDLTHHI